jgi:hypothetical protein
MERTLNKVPAIAAKIIEQAKRKKDTRLEDFFDLEAKHVRSDSDDCEEEPPEKRRGRPPNKEIIEHEDCERTLDLVKEMVDMICKPPHALQYSIVFADISSKPKNLWNLETLHVLMGRVQQKEGMSQ